MYKLSFLRNYLEYYFDKLSLSLQSESAQISVDKSFLFICGCPRSGTTALWRLMIQHPSVAIGLERYIKKVNEKPFRLNAKLFDKDRFFTYKSSDTHFNDLNSGNAGKYYAQLESRYQDCKYVGDKIPILYQEYDSLFQSYPSAKVIFIFRNIIDVANSFLARKMDKSDDWKGGCEEAVLKWNEALLKTCQFKKKGASIYCVEYESLFFSDYNIKHLFDELGLTYSSKIATFFRNDRIMSQRLDTKRKNLLSSEEKSYIMRHARFDLYIQLVSMQDSFE